MQKEIFSGIIKNVKNNSYQYAEGKEANLNDER